MSDPECTAFLQWALPLRGMRWAGFRKVRRQVCKRLKRRIEELGLADFAAYRRRLASDPPEWSIFDDCCHITISRFYRDRGVFEALRHRVLLDIAARAKAEGRDARAWSAGCASGEEPYTLRILWDLEVAVRHPGVPLAITATDVDRTMLERARKGCYGKTSLRELPAQFLAQAFDAAGPQFCIKPRHRGIEFLEQDLRSQAPADRFDLILCRYLAFTYFAPALQQQVLARFLERLRPGGYLVIGTHEDLPAEVGLVALDRAPQIFQQSADEASRLS